MRKRPLCVILSGPIGSGKTSALRSAVEGLAARGRIVYAVLQPDCGRTAKGNAAGFSMEFLECRELSLSATRFPLARLASPSRPSAPSELTHGPYIFDEAMFEKAEVFVQGALDRGEGDCVFGLDEIGRIELYRGKGLAGSLRLILDSLRSRGVPATLLCSVKRECVEDFSTKVEEAGIETRLVLPPNAKEALSLALGESRP